jgi:hypothetical protein
LAPVDAGPLNARMSQTREEVYPPAHRGGEKGLSEALNARHGVRARTCARIGPKRVPLLTKSVTVLYPPAEKVYPWYTMGTKVVQRGGTKWVQKVRPKKRPLREERLNYSLLPLFWLVLSCDCPKKSFSVCWGYSL